MSPNVTLELAHELNDREAFVIVSLVALGAWVLVYSVRAMLVRHRSRWALLTMPILLGLALIAVAIWYGATHEGIAERRSGVNIMFIALIGLLFGSLAAKPILSLFDSRFSMRRPLWGVLALAALMTVWYLPLWRTEITAFLREAGIGSFKAGVVEVSFRDISPSRSAVLSAGGGKDIDKNSAVARPSDPRPGLAALAAELTDGAGREATLARDRKYMAYLEGQSIPLTPIQTNPSSFRSDSSNDIILGSSLLLSSLKPLIACLRQYVKVFPDSQLLLVDVKPVIETLFTIHARTLHALKSGRLQSEGTMQEMLSLAQTVTNVRENVRGTVDRASPLGETESELTKACAEDKQVRTLEPAGRESSDVPASEPANLTYLQPYTAIALANLLIAHGSSDEALEVMTQWLDMWRCARLQEGWNTARCDFALTPEAREEAVKLPGWLGLRMEIELNLLLFRLAGEANIAYRDFLRVHQQHLTNYLARPIHSLDIASEIKHCSKGEKKPEEAGTTLPQQAVAELEARVNLFRTLILNENTLLRAEVHHIQDWSLPDLEQLYARSKLIANATAECLDPDGKEIDSWKATVADFQITKGIVGLAVSDRISAIAASSDDRDRALAIRNEAKTTVREGYYALKVFRDQEREDSAHLPLSEQVFWASGWEDSYQLAGRAIQQLNSAER